LSLTFYFDDNMGSRAVVAALVTAGINVVTADSSGNRSKPDAEHLAFAAEQGLTLVSADRGDFSVLHWQWMISGKSHSGIVIARDRMPVGAIFRALAALNAEQGGAGLVNQLVYLSRMDPSGG